MALVRQGGRVVAFANIWHSGGKEELTVDLMRYHPDAPAGVMDFLFIEVMRLAAEQGYGRFNLGMAPLTGLETGSLAPLWHRVGTLVARFGEHFYNFEGLRRYKEKFDPVWEPRYLAQPGGWTLPRTLADIGTLVSGGLKGVVLK
jgi:phosphatidylglycerol lysyltransferase